MFTICDLQLEPGRFHYITDLKFLSHASVTTLYTVNAKGISKVFWKTVRYLRVFRGI